ncbi:hypothetical protein VTN00DRAFT_10026 [Thermoascus crustaceus]|uniref:uncharacterized protein n=1 Tax=Thermoascus crustaceus TaxID=5088 RepID=UPI0037424051
MASLRPTRKGGTRQPEPLEGDKSPRKPSLSASLLAAAATASLSSSDSAGLVCAGSRCPAASCASDSYTTYILFLTFLRSLPDGSPTPIRYSRIFPLKPSSRLSRQIGFCRQGTEKTREELSKRGMSC